MLKSRISKGVDVNRMAHAVSRPGIDPRVWECLAFVTAVNIDEEGPIVDVLLMPERIPETARVAAEYAGPGFGLYFPIEVDTEVIVSAPNGDPDEGLVIAKRFWSASDPPPAGAISEPLNILLHAKEGANINLVVSGGATINLGDAALQAIDGVVTGQAIDSFTGATQFALGNASAIVKAKK
jgi:hypothetical protein